MEILKVENLKKEYGEVNNKAVALDGFDLQIENRKNSQENIDIFRYFNKTLKQTIILITHDKNITLETNRIITTVDRKNSEGWENE